MSTPIEQNLAYIYLGTGGYLINFLNVLPVASPAAKGTFNPTNRTFKTPFEVNVLTFKKYVIMFEKRGLLE